MEGKKVELEDPKTTVFSTLHLSMGHYSNLEISEDDKGASGALELKFQTL